MTAVARTKHFLFLSKLRLRTKLLLGFLVIIFINAVVGTGNLLVIQRLGELVNLTYDKALMAGTFAQAAKYDFAKVDAEVMSALLAPDAAQFKLHVDNATKAHETLIEDLQVVSERALSPRSAGYVTEILALFGEFETTMKEIVKAREIEFSAGLNETNRTLVDSWIKAMVKARIEEKLTLLYDDAAETGYKFRLDSELDNKKNLRLTTIFIVASFALSIAFSLLLAYSLMKPLRILLDACRKIESGNYTTRASITARDEFGSLARAFNSMLAKIETRDNEMNSLLSALPFGVFYFDRSGQISHQRSKATDTIFKNFSELSTLESFLGQYRGTKPEDVRDTVKIVVEEMVPFSSAVELLPSKLVLDKGPNARYINLSYRAQRNSEEKVELVIVVAEDATDKTMALRDSELQAERVKRISSASKDIAGYREFEPEALALFGAAENALAAPEGPRLDEAKRDLHSLKGLLGVYEFLGPSHSVHEIENVLNEPDSRSRQTEVVLSLQQTLKAFEQQAGEISEVLGLKQNESLRQYDSGKIGHIKQVAELQKNVEVLNGIADLDRFAVSRVMAKYISYCARLTERLGDKMVEIQFDSDSAEVSYAEAQRLDSSMVHLLRNCLDHGIESVEDRINNGKDETGIITIRAERLLNHRLRLTVRDDGRGIDGNRLAEKARANGLWNETQFVNATAAEKVELIFAAGLSTKTEATEISGRGVGMDAVREQLQSFGGSISIETEVGKGTRFILEIPELDSAPSHLKELAA